MLAEGAHANAVELSWQQPHFSLHKKGFSIPGQKLRAESLKRLHWVTWKEPRNCIGTSAKSLRLVLCQN